MATRIVDKGSPSGVKHAPSATAKQEMTINLIFLRFDMGRAAAISDKTGKLKLFICEEHKGDHRIFDSHDGRESIEIETLRLDDFFFRNEKIDFIKMDIQGAEYLALLGMNDLIIRNEKLIIISEFSPSLLTKSGFSAEFFIDKIMSHGFKLKFINEKKKTIDPISRDDLIKLCKGENYVSLYLAR